MKLAIKRGATTIASVTIGSDAKYIHELMDKEIVQFNVESPVVINAAINDIISVFGQTFYLNKLPVVKKVSTNRYQYTFIFEAVRYNLGKVNFQLLGKSDFYLMGDASLFLDQIVSNMNRVYGAGTWSKGTVPSTEYRNISFNNQTCLNVLQTICEEYELEFSISGTQITLATKIGNATGFTFKYGMGLGLYELSRMNVDSSNIITKLYVQGSDRNIPATYRNHAGRLMFGNPGSNSVSQNVNLYGVIEGAKTFDQCYPHRTGTITSVDGSNSKKFTDTGMDFDLNNYLVQGIDVKIVFRTGNLSGYEFPLLEGTGYVHSTKTFTLNQITTQDGLSLPGSSLIPAVGDTYVILGISMPQSYIDTAEDELYDLAMEELAKVSAPKVKYGLVPDPKYVKSHAITFHIGDEFNVVDIDLGVNTTVRAINITRKLISPDEWEVELADIIYKKVFNTLIYQQGRHSRALSTTKIMADINARDTNQAKSTAESAQSAATTAQGAATTAQNTATAAQNTATSAQGTATAAQTIATLALKNLLNWDGLKEKAFPIDGSSYSGFASSATGILAENEIVYGASPYGSMAKLWHSKSYDATAGHDGGYYSAYVDNPDLNGTYRFLAWFKYPAGHSAGTIYFGLNNCYNLGGGSNTNPYFWYSAKSNLVADRWYLMVGYLHPQNYAGVTSQGGIYDSVTGDKVYSCTDFRHDPASVRQYIRHFQYNCNAANIESYFFGAMIHKVDGSEPSLDSLLGSVVSIANSKAANFNAQPVPPYRIGDTWTDGTNIKRCTTTRLVGAYNSADWVLASTYDNTQGSMQAGINAPDNAHFILENDCITLYDSSAKAKKYSQLTSGNKGYGSLQLWDYDQTKYIYLTPISIGFKSVAAGTAHIQLSDNYVKFGKSITINPQTADPASPSEGWMYFNTTVHKPKYFNGTSWIACDTITDLNGNITFEKSAARTIGFTSSPTAGVGNALNITGQTGYAGAQGGDVVITSGAGGAYTIGGPSGKLILRSGDVGAGGQQTADNVYIYGGYGYTNGNVYLGYTEGAVGRGIVYIGTALLPVANITYSLGSASLRFNTINAATINLSGSPTTIASFTTSSASSTVEVLALKNGVSTNTTGIYIKCYSGSGTAEGVLQNNNGTFQVADTSDINIKTNIRRTAIDAIDILTNLNIWDFTKGITANVTGYIAQEVDIVYPQMASFIEDEDGKGGIWTVSKESLIPVLHKGFQIHWKKTNELELELMAAKLKIAELEQKIKAL